MSFLSQGTWKQPFNPNNTWDGPFYLSKWKTVTVPLMHECMHIPYYSGDHCSAVRIPFAQKGFSILFGLPNAGSSLSELETKLLIDNSILSDILHKNKKEEEVYVTLPRFTFRWSRELTNSLQKCGINDLFIDSACDLSGEFFSSISLQTSTKTQGVTQQEKREEEN